MTLKLSSIKILAEDIKRVDDRKRWESEPRWSVVNRLLGKKVKK